ncbi:NAD-dependent epimerase/dehydratase family protein [Halosimplex aquaticum]|uniref:NAD-dependent epimerase/dehydratase family protein n=1 Tax=Halosimplex aquaticum TaxID=3026162 RepID=A0ABD5Y6Q3_9EURY|nr:NAD(P)-dependent oxidoreductase [Halosimplex aquaticum]
MSRVLVTGGLGASGRWIVDRLASDGHAVTCVDQRFAESERGTVDVRVADLTDRGDVFDLVGEFDPDAVVHWGAIPDPLDHPGGEVFENNVVSTYNVLEAAGRADARVVWASSESALGFPFAAEAAAPDYLPVDEDHPLRPEDPYGVSKEAGEALARTTARRHGVPVVSIRPSWIQYPGEYVCLDNDPPAEGVGNFWSYVDVRDIASIAAAALSADVDGHEAVFAVADENYADRPTAELFEERFGEVPEPCDLSGDDAAISNAKAADLLDWEPVHSWREAADEDVDEPVI